MRLTCSACQAEQSLEAMVAREADARALAAFIEANVPLGVLMTRYLALFRPAKRRLGLARMVALFDELRPDLQRGAVHRKGRDWTAPLPVWQAAIEQVLATRDKGTLTLPFTTHAYLYEVIAALADKAEALAEREHMESARARGTGGGAPVAVTQVMSVSGVQPDGSFTVAVATPLPYDPRKGPSRSALATKAAMQAAIDARKGMPADPPEEPAP